MALQTLDDCSSSEAHLAAIDDTQFHDSCHLDDVDSLRTRLSSCAKDINLWLQSRRLQLNADKTEAIWFGSKANVAKLNNMDSYIHVGPCQI